ncbi:flagellar export protein FliJ [Parablautia intestinalis]|jgi:flagellar FliJ protein|uniref:Flagellar FliJ protein n=1 Tax=Parablautia intestinalis TaxID=2320100 RepID=A0A3A9B2G1_9FIRM|nr:flagellar export protein FliJ [Parablautia intestinalis]MCI8614260.1 flagellar export protein FliJ [Lachnospiraceae bacterium]RKI93646.1 flagellar export protein FliJ [Parablautia intestinalis]
MARFRYRMQSILNIKEKLEEQAKMEFAAARMHLDEEEEKLQVLFDRKESYENKGRELRKSSLKVPDILENRDAIAVMDEFIFLQKRQVKLAEDELEAARLKLQLARQETRTQERLREKAFEVFIHEENVKEAKEVDELTSYTHGRK